jgi:hypothetical protein
MVRDNTLLRRGSALPLQKRSVGWICPFGQTTFVRGQMSVGERAAGRAPPSACDVLIRQKTSRPAGAAGCWFSDHLLTSAFCEGQRPSRDATSVALRK